MKNAIVQECDSCGGTGLYSGLCEGKGKAVICSSCQGKGWFEYSYKPFKKRHKKKGIESIRLKRDYFIGETESFMTYSEFEKKFPVKSPL